MKRMLIPFAVIALALFTTCSKSTTHFTSNAITGKWQLSRQYADPGNGNGQWNTVLNPDGKYVQFNADGTLQAGPDLDLFREAHKYEILNSTSLCLVLSSGQPVKVAYELKDNILHINSYLCIEGCTKEFLRMDE